MSASNLISRRDCIQNVYFVDQLGEINLKDDIPAQTIIIKFPIGSGNYESRDLGKYCYLVRNSENRKNQIIDIDSFCRKRALVVKRIAQSVQSFSLHQFTYMLNFLDFLDNIYKKECNLFNLYECKIAYTAYTNHIYDRIFQSKVNSGSGSISDRHGSRMQKGARSLILSLFDDLTEQEILTWSRRIARTSRNNITNIKKSNDHFARMFAIHLRVFEQLTDFVMSDQKLPLVIDMSGLDLPYDVNYVHAPTVSTFSHSVPEKWGYWALNKKEILPLESFRSGFDNLERKHRDRILSEIRQHRSYYKDSERQASGSGLFAKPSYVRSLTNLAIGCFCYAFVADSGVNWSVLETLVFEDSEFRKDVNKTRIIGWKARAGYKVQDVSVSSKFLPYYRKFLKLRKFMGVDEKAGVFRYPRWKGPLQLMPKKPPDDAIRSSLEALLFTTDLPWVVPREWRWNVSYEYLKASKGDIRMTARVLGNSTDTVRKHYGYSTFEDSVFELSSFFETLVEYSRNRVRKTSARIPVTISEDSPSTLTGGCLGSNSEEANLSEGFTEHAPKPDCGMPITCVMCSKYALHPDKKDFIKLLSARYWLEMNGANVSINQDQFLMKYSSIIERIDEILVEGKSISSSASNNYSEAVAAVESGEYDPYWKAQIDAIIESGGVL